MPYWKLFYHITFGVKYRLPLILDEFGESLHNVMAAKVVELGGNVYAVGGVQDHVHLAVSIPPKIALCDVIGQVKGNSSHWVNHVVKPDGHFAWQNEYGVVSFGGKQLKTVIDYVKRQPEHHRERTTILFLERCEEEG